MTYSWIATSSYNTALQRMSYFVLAKTIERFLILILLIPKPRLRFYFEVLLHDVFCSVGLCRFALPARHSLPSRKAWISEGWERT